MKPFVFTLISAFTLIFSPMTIMAQKGVEDGSRYGHGEDSVRCLVNLTLFRSRVKSGNYPDALHYWRVAWNECPQCSQNLYIDGAKMYGDLIVAESDPARHEALTDTLMMIYDQRIMYFNQRGNVLGRKAVDLLRFRQNDTAALVEAYNYLKESLDLLKNESSITVVSAFMSSTYILYSQDKLSADEVFKNYLVVSDIMDHIASENPSEELAKIRESIVQKIIASRAVSCESVISYLKPQFENRKTDIAFLKKTVTFMSDMNCRDDAMYSEASEALYQMEPSAAAAFDLAKWFVTNENYTKAVAYYKEAIEMEKDPVKSAEYYYQMGWINFARMDDPQTARKYALQAIALKPGWGEPYILIGDTYATGKNCFTDEFEKNTIYWAAVDKFIQAKAVDKSVSEKATERIQTYSAYFPDVETIFFYSLKDGDPYTVGCWINEQTTVRSR